MAWGDADKTVSWGADDAPVKPKRKRTIYDEVAGFGANLNRGLVVGDELAGGAQGVFNVGRGVLSGDITTLPQAGQAFSAGMQRQRALEDDFTAERPKAAALARGVGNAAAVVVPSASVASGAGVLASGLNAARVGAMEGAAYGLADRGDAEERLKAGVLGGATGGVLGGVLGGAGTAIAARPVRVPSARQADAQVLADLGVSTTIPQRMGGMAKQVEDLAMRAPILGPAISGARARQVEQLNRGVALRALRPVGKTIPAGVKPGFDMIEHVDDALGEVYDDAARLVPSAGPDERFSADLASIAERKADLDEGGAARFDSIISARLNRLREGVPGQTIKQMHAELGKLQGEAAKKGEDTLASMLGDTRRALMGIVERASPEAGQLIRNADEGWQIYSIANDAAAQASNRGGVYTPGQLNVQVRAAGRRGGSNMTGKGKAPLQDVATAASRTLPDQFGNPGTANAVGLGGLGVGLMTEPATTAAVATGLSAASAPYWMMGRKIIEQLPETATTPQLRKAAGDLAKLARKDPRIAELRQQVLARIARTGAVTVSGQSPRAPAVEAYVEGVPGAYGASRR